MPPTTIRATFLVGLVTACTVAAGAPSEPKDGKPNPGYASKGQITYVRYCVACHGKEARGDGPLAGDLRVPVPDLTRLAERSQGAFPYDRVVRVILGGEKLRGHGTQDMPAWGPAFKRTEGIEAATVDEAVRNLAHYLWARGASATPAVPR